MPKIEPSKSNAPIVAGERGSEPEGRGGTLRNIASAIGGQTDNQLREEGQVDDQVEDFQTLVEEVFGSCSRYFRQRPAVAAGALVVIGFYLGWKIRP